MKRTANLLILLPALCVFAQVRLGSALAREDSLRAFLIAYLQSRDSDPAEARYEDAFIDLDGDGTDEAVVYLSGSDWCGTGGCTTFVLKRAGRSYRFIGQLPATRPPIRALKEEARGWRTLTASIRGAAFEPYEQKYIFNGQRYTSGRRVVGTATGDTLIVGNAGDEKTLSPPKPRTP